MANSRLMLLLLLLLLTTTTVMPAASPPASPREQLDKIIDALIGAGDFNSWAKILSAAAGGEDGATALFPMWFTFFVPASDSDYSSLSMDRIVFLMGYHIVPQRLLFSQLRLLKPLTRLPTLLPTKSILITNTSVSNFTLDDSLLSHPDLYVTSNFAVHGIQTLLNYSIYGAAANSSFTPPPPPPPPPQAEFRIGSSDAACLLWWEVFFLVVFGIWIVMIHDLMVV